MSLFNDRPPSAMVLLAGHMSNVSLCGRSRHRRLMAPAHVNVIVVVCDVRTSRLWPYGVRSIGRQAGLRQVLVVI
jgi:hypothetical protein